ncbi:MAG: T9SS type A sorting domain-containing protein, partial [Saprospiraceae bacterium]
GCNYSPVGSTTLPPQSPIVAPPSNNRMAQPATNNPCTLIINNQNYDIEYQYSLGEEEFNKEDFDEADLKYVPVSALSGTTRDNSSSNCRHYIDVAEVMVKVEEVMVMQKSGRSAAMDIMNYWDGNAKIENEEPILVALTAFPNPASDVLTIKIKDDVTEKGTLTMYNMLGQSVFSTTTYGRITQIGVQEMPAGIYRISWIGENEQLIGKVKVVVK